MLQILTFAALALVSAVDDAWAMRKPDPAMCGPRGGNIGDCAAKARQIAASPGVVALPRHCASGCTLAVSAPNVCVWPDALFRVHGAQSYDAFGVSWSGNIELIRHYSARPAFLRRVYADGALNRLSYTDYTAAQLAALGIPICRG